MGIRVGCQTYTWEMLGDRFAGTPEGILDAMADAGYEGVEFTNSTIGHFAGRPDAFRSAVEGRGMAVAAFAYATTGFTDPARQDEDLSGAMAAVEFAGALGVPLCLGGAAAPTRDDYDVRLAQAVDFYSRVADAGAQRGVTVCVHPHSHHESLLESTDEYARLLNATGDSGLMFNPDAGHVVRGGQDILACFRAHRDRIAYVHIKDVDAAGQWRPLGAGIIPWRELLSFLTETGYDGWVTAEEESAEAHRDPAGAVRANRGYLRELLGS